MALPTRPHTFNVMLSGQETAQLEALAKHAGVSKGAVVRSLLRAANAHTFKGLASCANGQRCLCPQLQPPHVEAPE